MKKGRKWLVVGILVIALAIGIGQFVPAHTLEGSPSEGETYATQDGYSMLVLYLLDGEWYLQAIRGSHNFTEDNNKLYMDDNVVVVNNLNKVGVKLYPEQEIEIPVEWDEDEQDFVEIPVTLTDLNLIDFSASNLPRSGHYARLDAVHPANALKAEVSRYYNGQWYTGIMCLVTLTAYQSYQANVLQVGDYVWVYYSTDPRPGHEGGNVPIVVDKVMYP